MFFNLLLTAGTSVFKKLKRMFSALPGVEECENQVGQIKSTPDREKEEEILHCLQEEQYTQNEVSQSFPLPTPSILLYILSQKL
jgi:hypothetical protein